jgi:hypothetical protein
MKKNTIIDGVAASEHLDSSGESLSIEGMDISSLGGPDSILNWEHGSKDRPGQVVGKVTFARKILKKEDAKSKRESYFWNKVKKPFVYIKAELFDGLGHSGAQDVAAMLKYKNKDKGEDSRLVVGFSIEGGKIEKKGMLVTKSIARDLALTIKPCNKVCDAEVIEGDLKEDFLYKNQNFDCEIIEANTLINLTTFRNLILEDIKKSQSKMFEEEKEQAKDLKITPKVEKIIEKYKTDNNMRKTLIAGVMSGSPDSKTGIAALTPEKIEKNVPSLEYTKIAGQNIPRQDVQKVTMDNPYGAARVASKERDYPSELKGFTRYNREKQTSSAHDVSSTSSTPDQTREQIAQTKGKGNYPTTEQHESLHHHLNRFEIKNPQSENSKNLRNSLVRHSLGYFDPEAINSVKKYLMSNKNYENKTPEKINEETLTHLSDYRTNPKLREIIRRKSGLTHPEHWKKMDNSIKTSWKNLIPDAKDISSEHLEHIHNRFSNEKPENLEDFYKKLRQSFKNEK